VGGDMQSEKLQYVQKITCKNNTGTTNNYNHRNEIRCRYRKWFGNLRENTTKADKKNVFIEQRQRGKGMPSDNY
jgi:hypothetical protein